MIGQRQRERLQRKESRSGGLPSRHHKIEPRPEEAQLEIREDLDRAINNASITDGGPKDGPCLPVNESPSDLSMVPLDFGVTRLDTSQENASNCDWQSSVPTTSLAMSSGTNSDLLLSSVEFGDMLSVGPGIAPHLIEDAEPADELLTLNSFNTPFMEYCTPHESQYVNSTSSMGSILPNYNCLAEQRLLGSPVRNYSLPNLGDYQSDYLQSSFVLHVDCSKSKGDEWKYLLHDQSPALDVMIAATSKFLNWCRLHPGSHGPPICPVPDMYSNYIHCFQTSTMLAYLHNASCIDLSIKDLLEMKSPFYRPNTTMADDPTSLITAARKPWIPIHLQPTLPQILFPHHPYLDLIPFPTLRARIITLANTSPWMFNPMELKKDIFSEGLFCFPNRGNINIQGSGQPWDVRSWQAAPWFVRKWRLLMASPDLI